MALRFSRLDRLSIRRLKAGEQITEHGITAERLLDGDVRYLVGITVDGRRLHRVVGRERDGVTRSQCESFIEQAKTDARAGRFNLPAGRKLALSFAAAAAAYLERMESSGGKNLVAKRRQLKRYLVPAFGAERLDGLSQIGVERYKKRRRDAGAATATIDRELATLTHLLNRALEWRWIDRVPVRARKFNQDRQRIIALSDDECARLRAAARSGADADLWLFIEFGLATAMRHREILAARFDQVDFARRRLYIPRAKAGEREQPITESLAETLSRERAMRRDPNGWIFPARRAGKSETLDRISKPFKTAVIAAGLDPSQITPHTLRHTAVTRLVEAGVDLATIQRISGHKTLTMVMRYAHVHGQHIDRAIAALDRAEPADTITHELHTPSSPRLRRVRSND